MLGNEVKDTLTLDLTSSGGRNLKQAKWSLVLRSERRAQIALVVRCRMRPTGHVELERSH